MEYQTNKLADKIYLVQFKKQYDLAMFFLRPQEFYESPSSNFRGKSFDILDYMEWYSKEYGKGVFTYTEDWQGFNFPSTVIDELWAKGISDRNKYDFEMLLLHKKLKEEKGGNYYLIGSYKNDDENADTIAHEIAHALYFTNRSYYLKMNELTLDLNKKLYKKICKWLGKVGYCEEVFRDEVQAYVSTGMSKSAKIKISKEYYEPLYHCFLDYTKDIDVLKGWSRPK